MPKLLSGFQGSSAGSVRESAGSPGFVRAQSFSKVPSTGSFFPTHVDGAFELMFSELQFVIKQVLRVCMGFYIMFHAKTFRASVTLSHSTVIQ